jgi:hypothetical protein
MPEVIPFPFCGSIAYSFSIMFPSSIGVLQRNATKKRALFPLFPLPVEVRLQKRIHTYNELKHSSSGAIPTRSR